MKVGDIMGKKQKVHSSGNSVLHIKNSSCRFYKTKKTGRIGKNCVHYNDEKKTCNLKSMWCTDSSNCVFYKKK